MAAVDPRFWAGRRVLLTGHTGFKGAWTALWLSRMGAAVTGLALPPEGSPNLWDSLGELPGVASRIGDIRRPEDVRAAVAASDPQICLHMAAQALVPHSYQAPVDTFAANVMGTAHVLDALREATSLRAALVVTTDKTYRNRDDGRSFGEDDPLGGDDPYSASKAAAEMAVSAWAQSYLVPQGIAVGSARAGNVVGGGDWSAGRLVPDLWRGARSGVAVKLRYPRATRPWQHVLEAVAGYLVYAQRLAAPGAVPAALNFGPAPGPTLTVAEVAEIMSAALGGRGWVPDSGPNPPEKATLQLDPAAAWQSLGWRTRLSLRETLAWTADWYRAFDAGSDMRVVSAAQIDAYLEVCATPALSEVA